MDTLAALHLLHPAAIPFENLNPLLGWPVALDIDSLQSKMITEGRGGWCFEQNILFRHALEALGFATVSLAARVLWNAAPGSPLGPRSHMLLLVNLSGEPYIADVGFGGNVLTAPLRLVPELEQRTPHETHRFVCVESSYVLEALVAGEWKPFYRFTLDPQCLSDYEVSNWYLCNHPSSFFRNTLLGARAMPGVRYALHNNRLSIHRGNATEKRLLSGGRALKECLQSEFGLNLPDAPELVQALERLGGLSAEV
jgi:N-hydroxyarylamine O-acetyltransferase